jgi:hypothetical protein
VDDHIPTNAVTGSAAFSTTLRRQIWAALVEKAASKAAGSYAALTSGNVGEGLRLLTGAPTAEYFVRTNELGTERRARKCTVPPPIIPWEYDFTASVPASVVDAAWSRLLSLHQSKFPMGVSSTSPSSDDYPGTGMSIILRLAHASHSCFDGFIVQRSPAKNWLREPRKCKPPALRWIMRTPCCSSSKTMESG